MPLIVSSELFLLSAQQNPIGLKATLVLSSLAVFEVLRRTVSEAATDGKGAVLSLVLVRLCKQ